eukprot:sb/3471938/
MAMATVVITGGGNCRNGPKHILNDEEKEHAREWFAPLKIDFEVEQAKPRRFFNLFLTWLLLVTIIAFCVTIPLLLVPGFEVRKYEPVFQLRLNPKTTGTPGKFCFIQEPTETSKQPIRTPYLGHVDWLSANQGPVFPDSVGSWLKHDTHGFSKLLDFYNGIPGLQKLCLRKELSV